MKQKPKHPQMQEQKSDSRVYLLSGIIVILAAALIALNFQTIKGLRQSFQQGSQSGSLIGMPVTLSGTVAQVTDLNSLQWYTHTLVTDDGQTYALRSKQVNMNIFNGRVIVDGTVAEILNGMNIIEVSSMVEDGMFQ